MVHRVTLIPGDGSGPELVKEVKRCLEATGVSIEWEEVEAGLGALKEKGSALPREVLDSIAKNRVALKGPLTTPSGEGYRSINVELRQRFDLFACVRPCKTIGRVKEGESPVDLVVIRENTEDLYAGIEFKEGEDTTLRLIKLIEGWWDRRVVDDAALSIKTISRGASRRIARFAFNYAKDQGREKITVVTKANIMKCTDGLFYEEALRVSREYPQIKCEHLLVDNACFQLVNNPRQFDIILTTNLYGDIISEVGAALVRGLGMVPSANLGEGCALFEAVHGSAPEYAGRGVLNPTALILSGSMMLDYLGEREAAQRLRSAVTKVVEEGRWVTPDLDSRRYVETGKMTDRIIYFLKKGGRCG